MNRWILLLCGMLVLGGCEAVRERRLEGYWVNRNTESSCFDRKAVCFAPFDGVPENSENYSGVYRMAYLSGSRIADDSVTQGWWRIDYAPTGTSRRNVYALILAPDGNTGAEQRFELLFDGDRMILADFQRPEITVERYSRVESVNGL